MYTLIPGPLGQALIRRDADQVFIPDDPNNLDRQAFDAWVAEDNAPATLPEPPVAVPDNPTLSDWRVALTLWGRIDDVGRRIAALAASEKPQEAMLGKIAKERFEYANTVLRDQLLQLKDVLGFGEAEIDESLWRADRVRQGDLSGVWPLTAA